MLKFLGIEQTSDGGYLVAKSWGLGYASTLWGALRLAATPPY